MKELPIRPAEPGDLPALDAGLRALAEDLGDPYLPDLETLAQALFGADPSAWAQIADGPDGPHGIVLFSPVFSTVRGGAGLYVSDLWVDRAARGSGLGAALLRSALQQAAALWGACFLRLSVYEDNPRARAFYDARGFEAAGGETTMVLSGQAFQHLRGSE